MSESTVRNIIKQAEKIIMYSSAFKSSETNNWIGILPTVSVGLRASYKEDIKATPTGMVYGVPLKLPGEFFINQDEAIDSKLFLEKFK